MSEKQYQECSLEEATHAQTSTGEVYETSKHEFGLWINAEGHWIHSRAWEVLGIKPLKEVQREPIEFEATFAKLWHGGWLPIYDNVIGVTYQNNKKTRFRCVEILEEEEKKNDC